jgi:hypothetical protein
MWKRVLLFLGLVLVGYYGPAEAYVACGNTAIGTWVGTCLVGGSPCNASNWKCAEDACLDITTGKENVIHLCSSVGCQDPSIPDQCKSQTSGCGCCPNQHNCTGGCGCSPIIVDLSGHGFILTDAANGVEFDISGTGRPMQMGWTAPGADNAFLALPGDDGEIHNGKQLFGSFTAQPESDTPNGFSALAVYDANHDGVIDARDPIWPKLRLWIDADHNGVAQTNELHTLPSMGVNSLSLRYEVSKKVDQYGNQFRYRAHVDPESGKGFNGGRVMYDVFFVTEGAN